jgi:acyl-CoA synthetase (AMP-forming)/AMP-acid ligase II
LGVACEIVNPKAIISFEKAFLYLSGLAQIEKIPHKIVCFSHTNNYSYTLEELENNDELTHIQEVYSNDTALITFTTGSSGRPKGADRTHEFLSSQHEALKSTIPYEYNDLDLPAFPIFSLNNLAEGVSTIIPITDIGTPTPFDPVMLISQIVSQKVTCTTLSPSMVTGIAEFCKVNNIIIEDIKRIVTGGAPISNEVLISLKKSMPNAQILVLYGSTEVEPIAHIEVNDIINGNNNDLQIDGVKVGTIVPELEYKIIKINKNPIDLKNKSWKEIETGNKGPGELIVSGLHVCKSYYNDPEAVIRAKIIDVNGKIWHRTGDVAILDENNNIWLIGRVHNTIVRKGKYLFPVGTEILLKNYPCVAKSAYIGIPDEEIGEKAYVVISLKESFDKEKTLSEIMKLLEINNIIYDQIEVLDDIPMDPRHHSKVEYELLRKKLSGKI